MYKTLLLFTLFSLCLGEEPVWELFKKLSKINDKWMEVMSMPEVAYILKHPPYSYHLNNEDNLNVSEFVPRSIVPESSGVSGDRVKSCSDDLLQILSNINSDWALKMLDSDGKINSGILSGAVIWPGYFEECTSVYAPKDFSGHGGFHGKYCVLSWKITIGETFSDIPLSVGMCVPDSCSAKEIKDAGKNIVLILERIPLLKNLSSGLNLDKVTCKAATKTLDASSIVYLVFISFFILITIIGSALTLWKDKKEQRNVSNSVASALPLSPEQSDIVMSYGAINTDSKSYQLTLDAKTKENKILLTENGEAGVEIPETTHSKKSVDSIGWRILACFSVFENGGKVLNVSRSSEGQILSIHGIRFLSLTWVIIGHTYITAVNIIGNRIDVQKQLDNIYVQVLLQAPFSVDTFFFLSGFLLAYLFLKEAERKNGNINWIYFYFHRFWRLTPAYLVVVFFYIYVFKFMGSGPFWDDNHCDNNREIWWKYVLYINNFIKVRDMCVGWSWYIANDMQFYVISPLFLYPLWKWPAVGFSILAAILAATWTATGTLSYFYNVIPMFVGATQTKDLQAYSNKMWDSFDLIYDKPYTRIAPYIIGVILGFILYKVRGRKNFLNWWQQGIGWILGSFFALSVIYGLYHVRMSPLTSLFYNSLCRSSFALGVAWVVFACETGHGGFITKFLSWKFFIPLSRLTYCAYLVHPILIHAYYYSYPAPFIFTQYQMVTNFMGFLLMAYGLAFAFSLVFESPLMNLEKLLLKRMSK